MTCIDCMKCLNDIGTALFFVNLRYNWATLQQKVRATEFLVSSQSGVSRITNSQNVSRMPGFQLFSDLAARQIINRK